MAASADADGRLAGLLAAIDWKWPPAGASARDRSMNLFLRGVLDAQGPPSAKRKRAADEVDGCVCIMLSNAGELHTRAQVEAGVPASQRTKVSQLGLLDFIQIQKQDNHGNQLRFTAHALIAAHRAAAAGTGATRRPRLAARAARPSVPEQQGVQQQEVEQAARSAVAAAINRVWPLQDTSSPVTQVNALLSSVVSNSSSTAGVITIEMGLAGGLLRDWQLARGVPETAWVRLRQLVAGQPHLSVSTDPDVSSRKLLSINVDSLLAVLAPRAARLPGGTGGAARPSSVQQQGVQQQGVQQQAASSAVAAAINRVWPTQDISSRVTQINALLSSIVAIHASATDVIRVDLGCAGNLLRDWRVASGVPDSAWVRISELVAGQPHLSVVRHASNSKMNLLAINLRSLLAAAAPGTVVAAGSGGGAAAAVPGAGVGHPGGSAQQRVQQQAASSAVAAAINRVWPLQDPSSRVTQVNALLSSIAAMNRHAAGVIKFDLGRAGSLLRDWLVASGVPDTAWVRISELLAGQPHLSIVTHPKIRSRKQLRINLRSLLAAAPAGAGAAAGSGACAAAAVPRADAGRAADGARDGGLQAWWRLEVGDKGVPRYSLAEAAPGSAGPPQPQAQVEAEVDEGLASMLPFLPDSIQQQLTPWLAPPPGGAALQEVFLHGRRGRVRLTDGSMVELLGRADVDEAARRLRHARAQLLAGRAVERSDEEDEGAEGRAWGEQQQIEELDEEEQDEEEEEGPPRRRARLMASAADSSVVGARGGGRGGRGIGGGGVDDAPLRFDGWNRLALPGCLHRIAAVFGGDGGRELQGITYRVGRHVPGAAAPLRDLLVHMARVHRGRVPGRCFGGGARHGGAAEVAGRGGRGGDGVLGGGGEDGGGLGGSPSLLLLGKPGTGKTTLLRDVARLFADDLGLNVVVIDTSNEIAGDGGRPHACIGGAIRMQVPRGRSQAEVMLEAVKNHCPDVVVIDEIGAKEEADAAAEIAQRGTMLVATAHGRSLSNLLKNSALLRLVGGVTAVTLGDGAAAATNRGVKTRLERRGAAVFQLLVELQERASWRLHLSVEGSVDSMLAGGQPDTHVRAWERGAAATGTASGGRASGRGGCMAAGGAPDPSAPDVRVLVQFETPGAEAQALALVAEAEACERGRGR